MKAFVAAVIVAIALAAGAAMILQEKQRTSWAAYSTEGARVGDPGTNLTGVN